MAVVRETREARRERLLERVRTLPQEPGCYLMKGRTGEIFYVGKAANLRARVRSYFNGADSRQFVGWLDDILDDLDVVVVRNEKEALLLERTLVQNHQPRFNVLLRDDKNFIHLRLDVRPPPDGAPLRRQYPRAEVVRNPADDGARYFGPYHSATSVRATLRVLNKHFQLRTCRDAVIENRKRPCLQHQIGRCPAPCVFPVPDYGERMQDVAMFLSGQAVELERRIQERMWTAAAKEDFEAAARLRDQLAAVSTSLDDQAVTEVARRRNQDVVAALRKGAHLEIARVVVRDGRMTGTDHFSFDRAEVETAELVESWLVQLYAAIDPAELPDEVLLGEDLGEDWTALAEVASERRGKKVVVRVPKKGHGVKLVEIAAKNAEFALSDRLRKKETREAATTALQTRLSLPTPPRVIECYDISLFQGTDAVASQVCFVDGAADKSRYRRYNIKTVEGTDDFAMLYEALSRRMTETADLPDLLIVDGGKGQLNVALAAAKDASIHVVNLPGALPPLPGQPSLAIASIAKARSFQDERPMTPREERSIADEGLKRSPERLFIPGAKDPLMLRPHTPERFLVEQVRDEAHRFAVAGHRGRRKKRTLKSVLDDIPGIGPAKRKALMKEIGGGDALKKASVEELAKVSGIGPKIAEKIKAALNPDVDDAEDEQLPVDDVVGGDDDAPLAAPLDVHDAAAVDLPGSPDVDAT